MTAERWKRIEEIFHAALDADPTARGGLVAEACAGDPALRNEVERMLRQLEEAEGFLETPAMEHLPVTEGAELAPPKDVLIGQLVGPYRIENEIGRGGMGTVYRAVRDDGVYLHEAALKVMARGLDTPELLDRFRRERQILAMLNHPNIARILDGGTTADGRPYYAMEFVEGEPLTQYCYRERLSLNQRLRLFLNICAAVAHAHQNLIIHRDLKPANILVTRDGSVRLLDFGIAKIFFEDLSDSGQTFATGAMLTPNYAAPEQIRVERVTTATDVYALGLILYELLTGRRAQSVPSSTPSEMERAVCEVQPPRPSEATNANGVQPGSQLRGDLEIILLKAIQKEPSRRYATVNQFSDDLERYLNGQPVSARPDSVWYRARMFVRRNKLSVAAAALVAGSLLGGITVAAWQAQVARRHLESVRSLARSLLNEISPAIVEVPGTTKARHLIAKRSTEYLDRLSASAGADPQILAEAAEAYETVADLQGNRNKSNLGDYQGAMASFRKSLALRDRIEQIAPSLENRRWIAMINATAARIYPNSAEALDMARKGVEIARKVRDDNDPKAYHVYPNTLFGLGYVLTMREQAGDALAAFAEAREIYLAHKRLRTVSVCDRYSGILMMQLGRHQEALRYFRRALEFDEPRVVAQPTPRDRMDLSYDYEGIAEALGRLGRWQEALPMALKARAMREELAAADPNDQRTRLALADSGETLGVIWAGLGERAKSKALLAATVASREQIAKGAPDSPEDQWELARTYMAAGQADLLLGHCDESAAWFAKARPTLETQHRRLSLALIDKLPSCVPAKPARRARR